MEAILAFPCDAKEKVGLGRAAPVPGAARMAPAQNHRATRAQELSYWPAGAVLAQCTAQAQAARNGGTHQCGCRQSARETPREQRTRTCTG